MQCNVELCQAWKRVNANTDLQDSLTNIHEQTHPLWLQYALGTPTLARVWGNRCTRRMYPNQLFRVVCQFIRIAGYTSCGNAFYCVLTEMAVFNVHRCINNNINCVEDMCCAVCTCIDVLSVL